MDPEGLGVIFFSLLFSAFFSGMEIAFVASNKLQLELFKKRADLRARFLTPFIESPSRFIATMLVGNNIALVVYGIEMAKLLEPLIRIYVLADSMVLLLQTILSTLLVLVTAEFLPKVLFSLNATRSMSLFAFPAWLAYYALYFVVSVVVAVSNFMLKHLLGLKNPDEKPVFARIDLEQYLKEHTSTRNRQEEVETEIQIFQNALDFSKVKARECMVPRNEIVAMDINQSIDCLRDKFIETGFSKIVIYRENIDQIVGYSHSYELFKKPESIKAILLPIAIVPESMTTNDILDLLIKERKSIALVLDEFGGTAGLITMEDVVEEIFGEIEDEYDNMALLEEKISDREYIFSGRHELDYLNEKFQLNIPDSDNYETLSGLIVHYHEDIPKKGALIRLKGFKFEILEVEQTRIEKVRLTKRP